jgi:hypothetical protein
MHALSVAQKTAVSSEQGGKQQWMQPPVSNRGRQCPLSKYANDNVCSIRASERELQYARTDRLWHQENCKKKGSGLFDGRAKTTMSYP